MRAIVMALAFCVGPAAAEDWAPLAGDDLRAALTARTVAHSDGTFQGWFADGTTLCETDPPRWGRWWVEGDLYCSEWPGVRARRCGTMSRSTRGLDLRLALPDGTFQTSRYVDLQ